MQIIDTHTHLFSTDFEIDIDKVINSAQSVGVQKFVLPNIDADTVEPMLKLSQRYAGVCYPALGLHPGSVDAHYETILNQFKPLFALNRFCAVGEIGIDLYWDKTFIAEQKHAFETQVKWAKEMNLPIIIHVREAFQEVFDIIDALNDDHLSGIFHCFTGTLEQAQHIMRYGGFKMGIGGVVTYKTSTLPQVLEHVPLSEIVLETDSPYLPPVPFRGKRNETSYILYVARKLAEVYHVSVDEICKQTTKNANNIFNFQAC